MGQLPASLLGLTNLNDLINDNNLTGWIPDFIQNWRQLGKLELQASGREGPIPLNISLLSTLTDLRISDLRGPAQEFPMLRSITGLAILVLRNCNVSGTIPAYVWRLRLLQMLDVSFNMLLGQIPNDIARNLKTMVLLICVTKVAKSAFDKALAEHEDIDDAVGSEEPIERDHGVDLQRPLLIKIDSSDSHQK
ncbi:hypothetical protein OROHE_015778 [Orobanche hederae]